VKAAKNITTRKVSVIDFKVEHLAPRYFTATTVVINLANFAKIHNICPTEFIGGVIGKLYLVSIGKFFLNFGSLQ